MVKNENAHLIISVVFGLIWIINGLILNLIQFACYILIRPLYPAAFRKINYYLIYSSWSQVVALSEYWTQCKITVYFADDDSENYFGKEHCITLMNHKYEVDWLYCWMMSDKLHVLGSAKTFAKKSLRWIPIIGWGWIFCEMIFLSRSWDKDSLILGQSLDRLMQYTDTITLLLFAEGTRFTPEKYENSIKYCKEKGLQVLKHHLYPRTRGFIYTIQRLRSTMPAVYNIQLAFPENTPPPTLMSILKGKALHGHLYIERIPVDKIPSDNEDEIANFLLDVYKKKDELTSFFLDKGHFPGRVSNPRRRKSPFIHLLFWATAVTALLFYFLYYLFLTSSYIPLMIIFILISAGLTAFYLIVRSTNTVKGSSYGKGATSNKSNGSNSSGEGCRQMPGETVRKRIIAHDPDSDS